MPLFAAATLVVSGAPPAHATSTPSNVLHVTITGVKSAAGHVRVDVCTEREFLKECRYTGASAAVPGATTVLVAGVPPGRYAVVAYHDKNDNDEVDRNVVGLPTEAVGFSNGVRIGLRAPRFSEAAINYAGGEEDLTVRLQHFID
jgi:uncharacterized protein (DUF2141 family)